MSDEIKPSQPLTVDSLKVRPEPSGKQPLQISFKHSEFTKDFCLSHCNKPECKAAVDCLRILSTMTFAQLLQQGGGRKTGLAFTYYPDSALKKVKRPSSISLDVKIAGVRASDKFRIFGAVMDQTFFILWFDRNHDIVPV